MATRKWRMREHFRGPVVFGSAGAPIDSTWYGDTASAVMKFDASEDELYLDGIDLWIKDDDQLEFGDVSDFVIDWNNTSTELLFLPQTAGNKIHWGSSTYQVDVDWDVRNVDIDLYGTEPEVNITRNLTAGATSAPVVYIKQDDSSDDQVALQLVQDAIATAALDVDGAIDVDSTYTGGAALNVARNLTSGASTGAVVILANSASGDDQPTVQITQTAANVAALDLNGALDVDISSTFASGAGVRVTRNLTSGNTDAAMVIFEQSNASDDMVALQVTQAATAYAGVDIDCAVDVDSAHTGAALDVLRNLTSGVTTEAVVLIHQDESGDDQAGLKITQDATSALALDANGWCDIGYEAAASPTGTPPTGSVKILFANAKWWWVVDTDGAGTLRYVQLSATSTA